jgi:hypothetical protein
MQSNRWFPVTMCVAVVAVFGLFGTAAFSHDDEKPGHTHKSDKPDEAKIKAAIAKLPEADRSTAAAQRYCPMMDTVRLGAMGTPIKAMIDGKAVFLCCSGCKEEALEDGKATVAKAEKLKKASAAIAKLPAADQVLAEAQIFCPIAKGSRLGSMGTPMKLMLEKKPVFICCQSCEDSARENSRATLAKVEEIKKANAKAAQHGHDADHDHKKEAPAKK